MHFLEEMQGVDMVVSSDELTSVALAIVCLLTLNEQVGRLETWLHFSEDELVGRLDTPTLVDFSEDELVGTPTLVDFSEYELVGRLDILSCSLVIICGLSCLYSCSFASCAAPFVVGSFLFVVVGQMIYFESISITTSY